MINIPYGESDFHKLMIDDYFYQDRTMYIEKLEKWKSNYPVFLRPRRFGKSLLISTLHHYYGLEHKQDFQKLFGHLYIGQKPTARANSYMVLRFEFSRIDTSTHERTYKGFLTNTLSGVRRFIAKYKQFFSKEDKQTILSQDSPEGLIKTLFDFVELNDIPHKIYVLIDEYDHFANELLSFDLQRLKEDGENDGGVHKFYESLKTAANEGIIDRIFITGVSPITLDSLTSGFNISSNITTNVLFHGMMGFTHQEVEALLYKSDISEEKIPAMMSDLTDWYDGYLFASKAQQALFNPDMVLYFLQQYSIMGTYPLTMLDTNVASDYSKIRNIFKIGGEETARFALLEQLIQNGYIDFSLTELYNLDLDFTEDDFLSLLFYMGMLRFQEEKSSDWRFVIPNYVIKKLYFEYFTAIFLAKTRFAKSHHPITQTIDALVNDANPELFFKLVEYVLQENHSNRDEMVYGEKHLQTLMIGLLVPYKAFKIHSEPESKRQYPDIFLSRVPDRKMNYEVVLELKYVKKTAKDKLPKTVNKIGKEKLAKVVQEAETQLDGYMKTERFSRPDVRGFYVVFFGGEVYKWGEWKKY